jgi:hypothetical protein
MSWLFSRALVEEFSADTCLDGELSAQLSVMDTPHKFWRNAKTMDSSSHSRFGLTCAVLTADRGAALLTSFQAAFPVRTSVQPQVQSGVASMASDLVFGHRWFALLARFDPESSTWRTAQSSLLADLDVFWETWPRSGSMRNGESFLRPTLELPTCESAYGFWPTPCATDHSARKPPTNFHISATGLPKHVAPDGQHCQVRLSQAVQMFRTPNASDSNKWSNQSQAERKAKGQQVRLGHQLGAGGLLNPTWVEWLMGWPIGWTDLKPLEMDRFREWRQQHSPLSPSNSTEEQAA